MGDLLEFGELLFDGVGKVSDYLFDRSFDSSIIRFFVSFLRNCQFELFGQQYGPRDELIDFLDMFSGGSVAAVIISGGIVTILGYRVVKFLLGIFSS